MGHDVLKQRFREWRQCASDRITIGKCEILPQLNGRICVHGLQERLDGTHLTLEFGFTVDGLDGTTFLFVGWIGVCVNCNSWL